MTDKGGQYLVMWQIVQSFRKPGIINYVLGKREEKLVPVTQSYNTEKFARMRYAQLRNKGGLRPYLLKVLEL